MYVRTLSLSHSLSLFNTCMHRLLSVFVLVADATESTKLTVVRFQTGRAGVEWTYVIADCPVV